MLRTLLILALCGGLFAAGHSLPAQSLSEDDFSDTGLVLRPMDDAEKLDGPSRTIPRVRPVVPEPPAVRPTPPPAPQPPQVQQAAAPKPKAAKVTGKSLTAPQAKTPSGRKAVSRIELAAILDKYLDYVRQQKADIEQKMEQIPIQKGLPPQVLEKLDRLIGDLDNLSTEEVNLAKMVKDLSGTVHEQGTEIQKLKITDMIAERRLERLERAAGLSKKQGPATPPTAEEADEADRLMTRVQRLEDLLYQGLSQLAENTTRLESIDTPSAPAAKPGKVAARAGQAQAQTGNGFAMRTPRIPFAAAGGIAIGAERQAYRQKLLQRVRSAMAQSQDPTGATAKHRAGSKSIAEASATSEPAVEPPQTTTATDQESSDAVAAATDSSDSETSDSSEDADSDATEETDPEELPDLVAQAKNE